MSMISWDYPYREDKKYQNTFDEFSHLVKLQAVGLQLY